MCTGDVNLVTLFKVPFRFLFEGMTAVMSLMTAWRLALKQAFCKTLAFWLRSSVVSVLNSLTTIMEAPPPFLVI